jgi:hypothetical protein
MVDGLLSRVDQVLELLVDVLSRTFVKLEEVEVVPVKEGFFIVFVMGS